MQFVSLVRVMPLKLGVIAGGGTLPVEIIKACLQENRPFFVIALKKHADPELVQSLAPEQYKWIRLGAAGTTVNCLHAADIKQLVFAGSVNRPSLMTLFPDFWGLRFLLKSNAWRFGDDGLLRRIIQALEEFEGFKVIGSDQLLPELLVKQGTYGSVEPDSTCLKDIQLGMRAAQDLGVQDIGQAVIVQNGLIIGQENKSGTNALICKISDQSERMEGGVLVKMKKPQQERRADLPAIGPDTIDNVVKAGLSGIAIEAGSAFILEQEKVIHKANAAGVFVVGVTHEP